MYAQPTWCVGLTKPTQYRQCHLKKYHVFRLMLHILIRKLFYNISIYSSKVLEYK